MIGIVRYPFVLLKALRVQKEKGRSPHWNKIRDHFLFGHPVCAACGSKKFLQVHHIYPYHLKPELELEVTNLLALCMSLKQCHLILGHGDSFRFWNPTVVQDVAAIQANPRVRRMIAKRAKKERKDMTP